MLGRLSKFRWSSLTVHQLHEVHTIYFIYRSTLCLSILSAFHVNRP